MKLGNDYAYAVRGYVAIPKAVFAALAVSYAQRLTGIEIPDLHGPDRLTDALLEEWRTLYVAGVIPQKPPTR